MSEVPAQGSNAGLESFAPVVEKVAPAVVRIVTASNLDSPAALAGLRPGDVIESINREFWQELAY